MSSVLSPRDFYVNPASTLVQWAASARYLVPIKSGTCSAVIGVDKYQASKPCKQEIKENSSLEQAMMVHRRSIFVSDFTKQIVRFFAWR